MTPFTTVTGRAIPLMLDDVNTDVIIRTARLATVARERLATHLFESIRLRPDGTPDERSVLNDPRYAGAPILLAGHNFGCGSSREGAVWALGQSGIRCVIAESFGDIFRENCFQNGLLPVAIARPDLERLSGQATDGSTMTVDLDRCVLIGPSGEPLPFTVDPVKRQALLAGLDDVATTSLHLPDIVAWQAQDRRSRPWVWLPA